MSSTTSYLNISNKIQLIILYFALAVSSYKYGNENENDGSNILRSRYDPIMLPSVHILILLSIFYIFHNRPGEPTSRGEFSRGRNEELEICETFPP